MKLQVVTPWYPDYASVYSGVFVQQQVRAVQALGVDVSVEVPHLFPAPPGPIPEGVVAAMERLARRDVSALFPTVGEATWIPAPVPARSGYIGRVQGFVHALQRKRSRLPTYADITHAHLGVPTGAAVLEISRGPLVITEHQSTLAAVLREPGARARYEDAIHRADAFFCVSPHLRTQLVEVFGDWVRESVEILPNIVDLEDIPFVDRPASRCSSWIYVGALFEHKGVRLLLKSFAEYRSRFDSGASLTLVGDGVLRSWVEGHARTQGIEGAVQIVGAVPHDELGTLLANADLLVHMSPAETFGIASLEGLGSGLPVVSLRNGGAEHTWGSIEPIAGRLLPVDVTAEDVAVAVSELSDASKSLNPMKVRRYVEDRYSPARVGEHLVATYERCLR